MLFPTNAFLARLLHYRTLCRPYWISRPEARRLYELEIVYGILWRDELLDELLFMHRQCYCTPERPELVYLPVWNDGVIIGWDEQATCEEFDSWLDEGKSW